MTSTEVAPATGSAGKRAQAAARAFRDRGLPGAVAALADEQALASVHPFYDGAEPLTREQASAVSAWLRSVAHQLQVRQVGSRCVDDATGHTVIPSGVHAAKTLDTVRGRLASLQFTRDPLPAQTREVLLLAEALLSVLDAEAGGFRT